LHGCISQGHTKAEAIANIKEAIYLYIECLVEDGIEVPEEKYEVMSMVV
jgi:predicted RNase H-like HicB family nuclease